MDEKFKFECPCGQHLVAPRSMAGSKVHCPACRLELTIPETGEVVDETKYARTERYAVVCACGRRMLVKEGAAGYSVHCPGCGKLIKLPSVEQLHLSKQAGLGADDLEGDELNTQHLLLLVDDEGGPGTEIS